MFHGANVSRTIATVAASSHLAKMLTAEQVSERLGNLVTPHQLNQWARAGRIPGSITIGRRRWFDQRTADWLIRPDGLPAKVMGPNGTV